jgi:hypothetical protein
MIIIKWPWEKNKITKPQQIAKPEQLLPQEKLMSKVEIARQSIEILKNRFQEGKLNTEVDWLSFIKECFPDISTDHINTWKILLNSVCL